MDLFINQLAEGTAIKNTDYTVFDVANTTTGSFSTQKISYSSLTKQLSSDISNNVKNLIDGLQANINTTNSILANKLDKRGLSFNNNEKMTGPLFINAELSANGLSHFTNTVNVYNNFIQNVKDPVLDQDAVNKRTLTQAINNINAPNGSLFLSKSGDVMTGGNLTLSAEPTISKHATTKKYVDDQIAIVNNSINQTKSLTAYIPLSGGIMTGGFITASNENPPTDNKHLSNKKYVDDQITTRTSNFVTNITLGTTYVAKAGDTMTGALNLPLSAPTVNTQAANKKYVDDQISNINLGNYLTITNANATYVKKAGDTMTGALNLPLSAPTANTEATNKKYVDDQITTRTSNFVTNITLGTNYVSKNGDTMNGPLVLKGISEKTSTPTSSATIVLYLSAGNTFPITLGNNVTQFVIANAPSDSFSITLFISQDTIGGRTVAYNFNGYTVKWANNSVPSMTPTANKTDIVCFTRINNVLYGFNGGQNF